MFHVFPESERLLSRYLSLLLSVAYPAGLVHLSERQAREQVERSLLLSELVVKYASEAGARSQEGTSNEKASDPRPLLLDVGSGAGLPAIPMAVALSEHARIENGAGFETILVEPKRRAVAFLEKVVRDLDLKISVFHGTAQQAAAQGFDGKGAFVTAKALARPKVALQLCAPLCKIGGKIVLTAKSEFDSPIKDLELSAIGIGSIEEIALVGHNQLTQRVLVASKS